MSIIFLIAAFSFLVAGCSGRSGELERLIESEPSLARLQRQLEWTLTAAEADPVLRAEQRAWEKGLERCLEAEDPARCVAEAHAERLADLQTRFVLTPRVVALDAAARAGFEFRALGNEPGWNLLCSARRCVWETDYGQVRHDINAVLYHFDGETHRYRATLDGARWEVHIKPDTCEDDMSGERFPLSATIIWDGKKLRGCAEPTSR